VRYRPLPPSIAAGAADAAGKRTFPMKMLHLTAALAGLAMVAGTPVAAQTTHETKVDHDTQVKDGVATTTTKVTEVSKRKTDQPKKVLGVKVGHKTIKHKTVRETSVSSDGDRATKVKTTD
jgi:hypothetical protein